jgi:VWFA-related protein
LKQNGKPVAEGAARAAGLWSSGQFKGDLRGVFHSANGAEFDYFGEDEAAGRKAWVFTFEIEHQNEPLWQLRGKDEVLAPAYGGEIWVDEMTGEVVRFRLTAKDLPPAFPIQSAEIQTDYGTVTFGDGTEFVLPVDSSVATRYQGAQPTKNVVRFSGCHKFAAKSRILTGAPRATGAGVVAQVNDDSTIRELEQNETIYAIFRDQAIREDAMLRAWEQQQDVNVATVAVYRRIAAMNAQLARQEALAAQKAQADGAVATLKVNVRLVPVSVVTRDTKGHAVGTLVKDNFALFDEKKPQVISRFTLEKNEGLPAQGAAPGDSRSVTVENSLAYVFDDLHATREDLTNAAQAAAKHLGELRAQERAGLFTISGETTVDFTADHDQLLAALKTLKPRTHPGWDCPQMTYYMADLIVNQGDAGASEIAVAEAKQCAAEAPGGRPTGFAEKLAISRALEVALAGRVDSDRTLKMLAEIIQRTAAMPGRKTIVLVSPGFLTVAPDTQDRAMALIDHAVQANVVVNVLDVTGLTTSVEESPMNGMESVARNEAMASLAYGTGGTLFHNNNDLNEGFRQTADAPEYIYVLGFSPQKLDGKFHKLKVALNAKEKLSVQARPGYYATKAEATQ